MGRSSDQKAKGPAAARGGPWRAWAVGGVLALALIAAPAAAQQHLAVAKRKSVDPGLGSPPATVVRSSPAGAWRSFLELGDVGEFTAAAHLLDLTEVPVEEQRKVGAEVAEKLYRVLHLLGAHPGQVASEDPAGPKQDGEALNFVVALRFYRDSIGGEVWLRRTEDESNGRQYWLFTRQTVSSAPFWYQVLVEHVAPESSGDLDAGLGTAPVSVRRGNPRETLEGFLAATHRGQFGEAAFYLDLDAYPPGQQAEAGARLARRLMLVLDRKAWVDPAQVSNDPAGVPEAGVPDNEEELASVKVDGHEEAITLARRMTPSMGFIWTFSPATVASIDAVYSAYGYGWIGDHLPAVFFSVSFWGIQLWQWTALLLIFVVGWGLSRLVGHWMALGLRRGAARTSVEWDDQLVHSLDGPLGFVLWGIVLALGARALGIAAPQAEELVHKVWKLLVVTGCGWFLIRLVDIVGGHFQRLAGPRNTLAQSFVPMLQRIGKVVAFLLLVLAALDVLGVNVVAGLAGLGLGGLALAFAAQKTLENVFGAVAIAGDRPFAVGDFVLIGDTMGTVEDVGLRSTRVRTLQRTLVAIPNGTVASSKITNFAARDKIFYNFTVGVVYGTTSAQLVFIVDEIRRLLLEDPRVVLDGQRTRFKGFGASSLDVEVFCWIATTDYNEYTRIAEDLNLKIMAIVERAGTSFAFPSQTLYLSRDAGLEPGRMEEIGAEVERRREAGELVVPEPSEEQLAKVQALRDGSTRGR